LVNYRNNAEKHGKQTPPPQKKKKTNKTDA